MYHFLYCFNNNMIDAKAGYYIERRDDIVLAPIMLDIQFFVIDMSGFLDFLHFNLFVAI